METSEVTTEGDYAMTRTLSVAKVGLHAPEAGFIKQKRGPTHQLLPACEFHNVHRRVVHFSAFYIHTFSQKYI